MVQRAVPLVVLLVTAGCLGGVGPGATTTGTTDGPAPVTYPEPPDSVSNGSATAFASAYERALATERGRNVSSGTVRDVDVSVNNVSVLSVTDGGVLVHVEYMVGVRVEGRSGAVTVSDTRYTANYYVTNETVRRAATDGTVRPGPDPWTNGTVVASRRG